MSELDKSLDDIIRSKKSARGRGGVRGRGGRGRGTRGQGRGGSGTGGRGGSFKKQPFKRQFTDQVQGKWQSDMFESSGGRGGGGGGQGGRGGGATVGLTKLMISNLDYAVSSADIKELFMEFGEVVKPNVHYDKSGRSLGTATVYYKRYVDAKKAFDQYNNVPLDGRPMTVQVVSDKPLRQQAIANGGGPVKQRVGTRQPPSAGSVERGGGGTGRRGGRRGGRGGGRGAKAPAPTLEELNADLDTYRQTESMES